MSMVFTAALERVDMRLLRVIVVVLRFRPSIHGVACEYQYNKGGKKGIAKRSVSRLLVPGCIAKIAKEGRTGSKRWNEVRSVGSQPSCTVEEVSTKYTTERRLSVG